VDDDRGSNLWRSFSGGDEGADGLELLGADAGDLAELVDGGEAAVRRTPLDDAVREDRADAGEVVELVGGGGVEVEDRAGGGGAGGGTGTGLRSGAADEALLAGDDLAGEVEAGGGGAGAKATGGCEGVGDAGAGREADEAGLAYVTGHVDDEQRGLSGWGGGDDAGRGRYVDGLGTAAPDDVAGDGDCCEGDGDEGRGAARAWVDEAVAEGVGEVGTEGGEG
jgi:hypothetical protein